MSEHFDVVVLGGTLSATIAAALSSARALRTCLIDQGELDSARGALLPDVVFDAGGSAVMEFIRKELGVTDALWGASRFDPPLQVIYPDARIDLPADREALLGEVRRGLSAKEAARLGALLVAADEGAEEIGRLLGAHARWPVTGFFARRAASIDARRRKATRALAESDLLEGCSDEIRDLVFAVLPFASHTDARPGGPLTVGRLSRVLARVVRGLANLGVASGARAVYVDRATRDGCTVVRGAVERVAKAGASFVLETSHGADAFSADVVIDASTDLSGLDALPVKARTKKLAATLEGARPKGHLHAFALEVDDAVVPIGLGPNALLLNGRRRSRDKGEPEDRPVLLLARPAADPSRTRLIALHPWSAAESHAESAAALDAAIRARIARLIPFLDRGAPALVGATVLAHPLYDPELDPLAGLGGVPTETAISGLLVAGPAVLPGLGVEGQYLAALYATDAAEQKLRKTRLPKTLERRLTQV